MSSKTWIGEFHWDFCRSAGNNIDPPAKKSTQPGDTLVPLSYHEHRYVRWNRCLLANQRPEPVRTTRTYLVACADNCSLILALISCEIARFSAVFVDHSFTAKVQRRCKVRGWCRQISMTRMSRWSEAKDNPDLLTRIKWVQLRRKNFSNKRLWILSYLPVLHTTRTFIKLALRQY